MLDEALTLVLGPDETLPRRAGASSGGSSTIRRSHYWERGRAASRFPFEWQEAVIRAAITLKLCTFEDTGAHRRRAHDLDPGGAGQRPQLGLPLLLGARRLLRRARAQSSRRDEDDGAVPALHRQHRGRRGGGPAAARVRDLGRAARLTEEIVQGLPGYRGMGPVRVGNDAYSQSPARRVRLGRARGHAALLRPAPHAAAATSRASTARATRRARRAAVRPARRGHLGVPRPPARAHLLERHVLGGLRPARAHRAAAWRERARGALARARRADHAR